MVILYDHETGQFFLKALWIAAFVGIIFKLFFTGKYEIVSLSLYLAMGWLVVFRLDALLAYTPSLSLAFLFAGGAAYSIGVIFYVRDHIAFNHPIWHVFVLLGSGFHYLAIYNFV